MEEPAGAVVDEVRARLRAVFGGKSVILVGGVAAAAATVIDQLRELGAAHFLVAASGAGTGRGPEGDDVEVLPYEPTTASDPSVSFRQEEAAIARPSAAVRIALDRFDPGRDAIVIAPPFLEARLLGDRHVFGARRAEWVALEDKTRADDLFDRAGVPRPPSSVVPADADSIGRAAAEFDRGAGTVWSGDARDGFNGGGACVRWVRDETDRAEALDHLRARCDRVRVAAFVEGVPCSIHGFVVDDGVAVFRPVELVTLRASSPPRLRSCGCATFFDPSADAVATMGAAVRRLGELLRSRVGFRGAFTLDGIAAADGWVATECNPRFGAGLGYIEAALPELCFPILQYAVAEGVVDLPSAPLEQVVVRAGDRTRWGGAWALVSRHFEETSTIALVGGANGYRRAAAEETPDAVLSFGPGRTGGHVRVELDRARTPRGPAIAPRAVAGFAFADGELDLGLGPFAAAIS